MSQVVSSQPLPNSTSQENASGTKSAAETADDLGDCGCRVDRSHGCFMYYCCNFLDRICGGAGASIESCFNCCVSCMTCCCDDEPVNTNKSRGYFNNDKTWRTPSFSIDHINFEASDHHSGHHNSHYDDAQNSHHHSNSHCNTGGHYDSGGHHDSGWGGDSGGGTCDSGWGGDSGGGCDSGGGDTGCTD